MHLTQDGNGLLGETEIDAICVDLIRATKKHTDNSGHQTWTTMDSKDVETLKQTVNACDMGKDGKIDSRELKAVINAVARNAHSN